MCYADPSKAAKVLGRKAERGLENRCAKMRMALADTEPGGFIEDKDYGMKAHEQRKRGRIYSWQTEKLTCVGPIAMASMLSY